MKAWLLALGFSQLVKVPLYLSATERKWVAALGAGLLTHPIVWFLFGRYWPRGHFESLIACSVLFSVAVEAAWLASFGAKRPIEWSLVANVVGFGGWMLLNR